MNRENNVAHDRGAYDCKPDLLDAGHNSIKRVRWSADQWQPREKHRVPRKQ